MLKKELITALKDIISDDAARTAARDVIRTFRRENKTGDTSQIWTSRYKRLKSWKIAVNMQDNKITLQYNDNAIITMQYITRDQHLYYIGALINNFKKFKTELTK